MITLLARIIVCAVLAPLFASISLLAAADAKPATLDPSVAKQIDAVFVQWDNTRSPGAVIAVSRHGKVIFTRGYGMSNLENDIPLSPDSIFHVASISKQFTAACVQLLAAEGKLSWTDDIRRLGEEGYQRLEAMLAAELVRTGAIHISKSGGMFRAVKS